MNRPLHRKRAALRTYARRADVRKDAHDAARWRALLAHPLLKGFAQCKEMQSARPCFMLAIDAEQADCPCGARLIDPPSMNLRTAHDLMTAIHHAMMTPEPNR